MPKYNKKENGKNATGRPEKWTLEFTLNELAEMWQKINTEDGKGILFFKELCLIRDYAADTFLHSTEKHRQDTEFIQLIKKIKDVLETRLLKVGISRKHNSGMAIFILKNHYDYRDTKDINQTVKGNLIIDGMSREELLKRAEEIAKEG